MILYKYTVSDRIDVLEKGEIRFTQPTSFNDPFETLPYVDAFVERSQIEELVGNLFGLAGTDEAFFKQEYDRVLRETLSEYQLPEEYADLIRRYSAMEALSAAEAIAAPWMKAILGLDPPNAKETTPKIVQEKLSSRFGTLCLTEKPDNLLMWAHYAECHRGFLIGFEPSHPYFDQRRSESDHIRKLKKVQYSRNRPQFAGIDLQSNEAEQIERIADTFFLTKSAHWEYEHEWRMMRELEEATRKIDVEGEQVYLFSFPPEAVKAVVIGSRMPSASRERLLAVLQEGERYRHVEVFQAAIDPKEFRLNINPL